MDFDAGKQFTSIKNKVTEFITKDRPAIGAMLEDVSLSLGLAEEGKYGVPGFAPDYPIAMGVGDARAYKGEMLGLTDDLIALSKTSPDQVGMLPQYNKNTGKFDFKVVRKGVGDSLIDGQAVAPWTISFFEQIAKKPLSYSYADRHVKRYTGNNPWAKVMTLLLQDYAGAASIANAGSISNNMSQDVNLKAGQMSSMIINAIASYSITREELEQSKQSNNPFAGRMTPEKEKYVNYCLKLIRDVLIYYGNEASGTEGLLTVNTPVTWGGTSLADVAADGANVTKGSTVYASIADKIGAFLSAVDFKFNEVNMAVSPDAYRYLNTFQYSNVYNPTPPIEMLRKYLQSDMTKDGRALKLNIFPDPLLKASSIFNAEVYDYMVLTAPAITAGTDEEAQDLLFFGEPIEEYKFPVIPGMNNTQYKTLKRMAGVFAPLPAAVVSYYGFGKDS